MKPGGSFPTRPPLSCSLKTPLITTSHKPSHLVKCLSQPITTESASVITSIWGQHELFLYSLTQYARWGTTYLLTSLLDETRIYILNENFDFFTTDLKLWATCQKERCIRRVFMLRYSNLSYGIHGNLLCHSSTNYIKCYVILLHWNYNACYSKYSTSTIFARYAWWNVRYLS